MKHEELYLRLRKTKPYFQTKTLKAIIELHKPDSAGFCSECFGTPYVTYPCSTIQVIEKELA